MDQQPQVTIKYISLNFLPLIILPVAPLINLLSKNMNKFVSTVLKAVCLILGNKIVIFVKMIKFSTHRQPVAKNVWEIKYFQEDH
jgi:hypothetical protein